MPMGFYFSLFGLDWVMLRRVVDLFECWRGQFDSLHNVNIVEDDYLYLERKK